jgi:tetratricopeptide (TPR) repeat protein
LSLKKAVELSHGPDVIIPRPPLATGEIQLIDRAEELGILRETVDSAVRGEGGLVFLYGEAGIGKTRLAREIEAYAHMRGMQTLYGRCPALFRMDGVPPYTQWSEVIKNYLEVCTPQQLYRVVGIYPSEVSKLVPQIRQRLGAIQELSPISPEQERDRLFEAVSQFVINISRETPLLVILDDLQWTDQSSLLLLHYVARGIKKESLLLLGEYRDTDIDERHPLYQVLAELNRERLPRPIHLKRISIDEIAEMIKQTLGQEDVPKDFCELVYEKTRGNPFFTEEVIKSLKEEEIIYHEGGKWKIKEVSRIEFPPTVKSVIENRISRLDEDCRNVLMLASFIGKDFIFEPLCKVTNIEEDKLLKIVEKILDTGLIKEKLIRGEEVYSFADIIVRDVVHEEVSLLRHKRLHSTIGSALEELYSDEVDEHLGELAYHFLEGGNVDKALGYFLKAGEKAEKVYAHGDATSYFQSALELLKGKKEKLREGASVLEWMGDIKSFVGDNEACMRYWNEALSLWVQLHEQERIARGHRKMASAHMVMGDTEKAKEHHTKALEILEAEPKSIELASLYEDIAKRYFNTGDAAKALSWAEKALDLAKELNAQEVVASSYATLGTSFMSTWNLKKAVECLQRALGIALDNNYVGTAIEAYGLLGWTLPLEGYSAVERRLEYHQKAYELAKKAGAIRQQAGAAFDLASKYFGMGEGSKVRAFTEESVALCRKAGDLGMLYKSLILTSYYYQVWGELDKSDQYLKEALNISKSLGDTESILAGGWQLGEYYINRGDFVKAEEILGKWNEVAEKGGYIDLQGSKNLTRVYIELGEIEKAKKMIDSMKEYALQVGDKLFISEADALRGMQFRAEKKWQESIDYFEKSLQESDDAYFRRWGAYWFADRFLMEYARVYLERDKDGDREKAHKLLDEALEIFKKIGAKGEIEKIISKKKLLTA